MGLDGGSYSTYAYVKDNPVGNVDPEGLYSCTYSISTHEMSCIPDYPGHPWFDSTSYVTGNNGPGPTSCGCKNNSSSTSMPFQGPLPLGSYSIGHQKGGGSSRRRLTPDAGTFMFGRDSFQLHGCSDPSTCSNGCIAATTNKTRDRLNQLLHLEEGHNRMNVTF
jgi:hypothetical protein